MLSREWLVGSLAKHLVHLVGGHPLTKNLVNDTVDEQIKIRTRPEVREGAAALMQKRPPTWATQRLDAKL
ncbi:hypothetical protein DIPPA_10380 [Diplonema papillatum]|nr:hypothetical protein DIPPA_10380 [Diplonema papillatum]